jgi:heme-degrading monooxygenase HmoA
MESNRVSSSPADLSGSALVVNAWVVEDGQQEEFVQTIDGLFGCLSALDGFIEGELLRGTNPTRFVSWLRMRSPQHRQHLFDNAEVSTWLRRAERLARADLHNYTVLRGYNRPDQWREASNGVPTT